MLESLGYAEVPERAEADLILFNTCSIREKADERFVSHLYEARALKRRDPERVIGVGGCWAQSMKDRVFAQFPFVDVAFGPGQVHKLAEFLTSDCAHRPGLLRVRGLHRPPARQARARRPRLGADQRRLQHEVLVLHRADDARARGLAPVRGARGRGRAARRRGRARGHAARARTSTPTARACARSRASSPSCCARSTPSTGIDRVRYTSPHPAHMTEDVIRAHAELESVCQHIHLPLQSGSSRVLKRDAPHLRPRALPGPRRADPRARARTAR